MTCTAKIEYVGDGSSIDYPYPFTIEDRSELRVAIYDSDIEADQLVSNWTEEVDPVSNGGFIRFSEPPVVGAQITIYRVTIIDPLKADFKPGHPVKADDLNSNFEQLRNAIDDLRCLSGGDGDGVGPQGPPGEEGPPGEDGKGWTGGEYDSDTGQVFFYSDDGLEFNTSDLRGPPGKDGEDGKDGKDGQSGAALNLSATAPLMKSQNGDVTTIYLDISAIDNIFDARTIPRIARFR